MITRETNGAIHVYDTTVGIGENPTTDAVRAIPSGLYKRMTATGTVKATAGTLVGFYVAATSSGTLVLRDGGSSGTQISGTITPAVGWHFFPADFGTDLHATIGGTSLDVTFIYK